MVSYWPAVPRLPYVFEVVSYVNTSLLACLPALPFPSLKISLLAKEPRYVFLFLFSYCKKKMVRSRDVCKCVALGIVSHEMQ